MNGKKAMVSRGFRKGNRRVSDCLMCCSGHYPLDPEVWNEEKGKEVILDWVIPCHNNRGHSPTPTELNDFL
jgi:hypothetical protein